MFYYGLYKGVYHDINININSLIYLTQPSLYKSVSNNIYFLLVFMKLVFIKLISG